MFQDNYRGLTLITIFAKVFGKCFYKRVTKWCQENNILSQAQGAGKEHCSSIHSAWLVKETICSGLEKRKTVFVGLLDTKKAFDTVWQNGLFLKMYQIGLHGRAWRMFIKLYDGFLCCVKIGGKLTDVFKTTQGIHQGAPLSMDAYCINNNDMINELSKAVTSIKIGQHKISCAAFADDITLIGTCENDLQLLFDMAYRYSLKWRFAFNPTKCSVLVFGK